MIVRGVFRERKCEGAACPNPAFYVILREDWGFLRGPIANGWYSLSTCADCLPSYLTSLIAGNRT